MKETWRKYEVKEVKEKRAKKREKQRKEKNIVSGRMEKRKNKSYHKVLIIVHLVFSEEIRGTLGRRPRK